MILRAPVLISTVTAMPGPSLTSLSSASRRFPDGARRTAGVPEQGVAYDRASAGTRKQQDHEPDDLTGRLFTGRHDIITGWCRRIRNEAFSSLPRRADRNGGRRTPGFHTQGQTRP